MRSAQTSLGSPIDTHTSVSRTSQPLTASATSSVSSTWPPLSAAKPLACARISGFGQRLLGAAIRTSMPSFAPPSRYESAMLKRASPR